MKNYKMKIKIMTLYKLQNLLKHIKFQDIIKISLLKQIFSNQVKKRKLKYEKI